MYCNNACILIHSIISLADFYRALLVSLLYIQFVSLTNLLRQEVDEKLKVLERNFRTP